MSDRKPPRIADAPGLVWRPRKDGWVATWQARTDLIKEGFLPQSSRLWAGDVPTDAEAQAVAAACRRLQGEMLTFSREGAFRSDRTVMKLRDLINTYQVDPASTHRKKRYHVRKNHELGLARIAAAYGDIPLNEIRARQIILWHDKWSEGGKISMAHMMVSHLRTMFGFGATMLENPECERLCGVMHHMRFEMSKPRQEVLTAEMATAIRNKARQIGWFSIALAQAFQFDLMLRQKDVIGEMIPLSEPGVSDVVSKKRNMKWLRGLRWEEIDENLILRHVTSKRDKPLVVDLKMAPMVMEELEYEYKLHGGRPSKGPIIICEATADPWVTAEFRRKWRIVADIVGIPKTVRNQDSRAGAISEATEAGADLEHVRHAATHSDISMTQRYSRKSEEKVANVQKLRLEHRNKTKTT